MVLFSAAPAQTGISSNGNSGGGKSLVEDVVLKGARSFEADRIKGLLYTKPDRWYTFLNRRELSRVNVRYDGGIIKRFYNRRGFLFAAVRDSTAIDDQTAAT